MPRRAKSDSPRPEPAAPRPGGVATALKVVAGVSAVLSLAFAIRQAVVYVGDARDRDRRVGELLATAGVQRDGRDYRAAWKSLSAAAAVGARTDTVQTAREDLAMRWLDDASGSAGMTLGGIGDSVAPVLTRHTLDADVRRRGDLLAHLGWADFLRWRDGAVQLDPAARYRQALAADSTNPYAHAMLAHWILWSDGSADEASAHFAAALRSGRERPFVRRLELAAYGNQNGDGASLLRVADAMRTGGDSVSAPDRHRLWNAYESALFTRPSAAPLAADRLPAGVAPRDLLATYRWLFDTTGYAEAQGVAYAYRLARLQELAGDDAAALATLHAARTRTTNGDAYRRMIDEVAARLTRAK